MIVVRAPTIALALVLTTAGCVTSPPPSGPAPTASTATGGPGTDEEPVAAGRGRAVVGMLDSLAPSPGYRLVEVTDGVWRMGPAVLTLRGGHQVPIPEDGMLLAFPPCRQFDVEGLYDLPGGRCGLVLDPAGSMVTQLHHADGALRWVTSVRRVDRSRELEARSAYSGGRIWYRLRVVARPEGGCFRKLGPARRLGQLVIDPVTGRVRSVACMGSD